MQKSSCHACNFQLCHIEQEIIGARHYLKLPNRITKAFCLQRCAYEKSGICGAFVTRRRNAWLRRLRPSFSEIASVSQKHVKKPWLGENKLTKSFKRSSKSLKRLKPTSGSKPERRRRAEQLQK